MEALLIAVGVLMLVGGGMYGRMVAQRNYFRDQAGLWYTEYLELEEELDETKDEADFWKK